MSQPGIEPGHPRKLYPDDVNRNTIGHVGHPIYDVNDSPIYISHTFDPTFICNIIDIYYIYIQDIYYIYEI